MPPQIFKGRVIATAGPLPGQLTIENLKRWTANRRGRFSDDFDDEVTHLLCTRQQFRKKVPRVKEALRVKGRRLCIVHCDWFEESAVHNRKLPEADYSMKRHEAERRAAEREAKRIERGIANGTKFVNTNFYHIYRDREYFPYQIELIQYHEETGQQAYKYTLCLWESNAKPRLHWFTAKLLDKNPGKANVPHYHRGSEHAVKWRVAFDQFQSMFEKLAKISWEDRISMQGTVPTAFQYIPPAGGKPVGRRLRHPRDYCLEINASLRGLPWPPLKPAEHPAIKTENDSSDRVVDDANEVLAEEMIDEEKEAHLTFPQERAESDGGGVDGDGKDVIAEHVPDKEMSHDSDFAEAENEDDDEKSEMASNTDSGIDLAGGDEAMD